MGLILTDVYSFNHSYGKSAFSPPVLVGVIYRKNDKVKFYDGERETVMNADTFKKNFTFVEQTYI